MMTLDARRGLARAARRDDAYCAGDLHRLQQRMELDDGAFASWMGIDAERLYALALCKSPRSMEDMLIIYHYVRDTSMSIDQASRRDDVLWRVLCFLIAQATLFPD